MLKRLSEYRSILVRLPNALGDAVMATPFLRRLAAAAPDAGITVCGPRTSIEVLTPSPWFKRAILDDKKGRHRGLSGVIRMARELETERFELALILPNSFRTALICRLADIPARVGYFRELRRGLLTAGKARDVDEHGRFAPKYTGRYFDKLLDLFPATPRGSMHPELFTDEEGEREFSHWSAGSGYEPGRPLLIVAPGAAFGPSKIWLVDRYAAVTDELARHKNAQALVSFGPGEEAVAAAVKSHMKTKPLADARLSLKGLKALYRRAAFVLTNDTGPRHLAVAFNIPHVTIMGPNDPRYTNLASERGEVVRMEVPCSPCQLKVCPLPEQICMTHLTAGHVLERCVANW